MGIYRKSHIPDGPGYEEKFYELGTPINRCEAVPTARPAEADVPVTPKMPENPDQDE